MGGMEDSRSSGHARGEDLLLAATMIAAQDSLPKTLVAAPKEPRPGKSGAAHLTIGARVGRYVVVRELGAGGMGVVYAAYDPQLDRKVALKLLLPEVTGDRSRSRSRSLEEARARFVREAHALARLSHPNVVAIYDVGEAEGCVWLAMEHVDGVTLDAWLNESPRTTSELLEVMIAAGHGLEAAHEAGLLHRDFKPENVMIGRDGRTRVMDLGLARGAGQASVGTTTTQRGPDSAASTSAAPASVVAASVASTSASDVRVTRAGALVGSPAYMSPEQFSGHEVDVRSDIFAYCVTLYEALHGERPFPGESLVALAASVLAGKIKPPPRSGRSVPRWLRRVYARGLEVEPEQRFASMTDLLAALERGKARARRRRWVAGAAVVAAAAAVAASVEHYDMSQKTSYCASLAAEIDEVWDDTARERLRTGFLATGAPFALHSLEVFVPWLNDYREAWRAGRTEACVHATIDRDWDDALVDRSSWCFEDRRLQLEATVEQIATLNRASSRRAVRIASYLDPVEPCLDPKHLERLPAPPLEMRDEVRAIRSTLSRSDRLRHSGRQVDALEVASGGRERAEALGWSPLLALARFIEGRCALEAGQTKLADETLVRAYFEAQRGGSLEVAFRAARSLISVYNGSQRYRDAAVWAGHADVLAASLEDPSGLDEAEGRYLLSSVRSGLGDYDGAAIAAEQALAMRRDALGAEHPITAASIRGVGIIYLLQGRHREALEHLQQAAQIWEDAVGHEHPYIAQLATLHGRALWSLGQVDEAIARLHEGLALHERLGRSDHPNTVPSIDALGRVLLALDRVDEAEPLLERGLAAARANRGVRARAYAMSLLSMAELDRARGREKLALSRSAEAVELLESTLDPDHPEVASAQERVAEIDRALGRVDEGITRRREALSRREAAFGPEHGLLRAPLEGLGDALAEAGRVEEARASYERALAIGERLLGPDDAALAPSLSALARIALAEGDRDAARSLALRAVWSAEDDIAGPRAAADAHFVLAQALADGEVLTTRTRELARQALVEYTTSHDVEGLTEVERWLADHGGP